MVATQTPYYNLQGRSYHVVFGYACFWSFFLECWSTDIFNFLETLCPQFKLGFSWQGNSSIYLQGPWFSDSCRGWSRSNPELLTCPDGFHLPPPWLLQNSFMLPVPGSPPDEPAHFPFLEPPHIAKVQRSRSRVVVTPDLQTLNSDIRKSL